jgi:hypothetical protein
MPCLWIHRSSGSDFLVRGDGVSLVKLSRDILSKDLVNYNSLEEMGQLLPQISLVADDFLPERNLYHEISYVTSVDAYKMTLWNIFPEDHFRHEDSDYKLPKGFIIRNRDEPYDFTRKIPTAEELDKELADYFN